MKKAVFLLLFANSGPDAKKRLIAEHLGDARKVILSEKLREKGLASGWCLLVNKE